MADQPLIDRLDGVIDVLVARGDASGALHDQKLAPLARLAADLRHYPDRGFTTRLRALLERRTTMTTALAPAVREGFLTVTPYVWVPDRGLADFVVRVFDAVETNVMNNPGHGLHREMRIGNSMLMIGETGDQKTGLMNRPVAFHIFVADVDATFARAIAVGGTSMGDPEDRPYGERSGFVRDAYGNHWYIATVTSQEAAGRAQRTVVPYLHARDVASYMDFLARAFGAIEEERHEQAPGLIPYARVRIGDAPIEFGTTDPMPGAYFMYVADPDAVYEQALAAGATSLSAPADRPTGRIAFVEDPIGNHWYIARPM
jgi:PhnB protein